MRSGYCKHGRLLTVYCYACAHALPSAAEERERIALIAGTPVLITGTKHNNKRGTVKERLSNGYNVELDGGEVIKFYHVQLIPYPEVQAIK